MLDVSQSLAAVEEIARRKGETRQNAEFGD
jgi:hypothetical protein